MFDKAEQEFKDLSEKKRIVANDKQKIHRVRRCACCAVAARTRRGCSDADARTRCPPAQSLRSRR